MLDQIYREITRYSTIIIHRHNKPDGDAIGSQVGLKHIIKDTFPDKTVYTVGDDAGRYRFMDDSVMDEIPDEVFKDALCIILDCGGKGLVSDTRFETAARTARIDHHVFSGAFTDVEAIDADAESSCGQVTRLAMEHNMVVSPVAAKSLYTGMVTDSGRFRYDSVSAQTFREAAFLMERQFDMNDVYLDLYADDYEMKRKRALFILKVQFTQHNVAYVYNTREDVAEMGMDTFSVSRGMVNSMADIRGVNIWVNFTESDNGVLCELRSGKQSVVHIAVKYGGGGHAKACGATLKNKEEAMQMLADLDAMMQEEA